MTSSEGHKRVGDSTIFVRDAGDGPPILLLNGIGAHIGMWRPLEEALRDSRVISFDLPGTGRSPARPTPATMPALARLTEELLDGLGLDRVDVLGYSFGGQLAQQFALQAPLRVRRLVLAATQPGWGGVPGSLLALLAMGTPLRYYSRTFYERTAGAVAGGRARADDAHVRRLWRDRSSHAPSFTGYAHQLWAMSWWTSLPWLDRVKAPTLLVIGDDDPLVPMSNPLMMAAKMPNARVHVVPREGHFLLLDADSPALPAIHDFVAAKRLSSAPVWRSALRVDADQVHQQMGADGWGALPWGAVSAAVRSVCA
jgi:pimeloyl-ACP methyl ester carboxylesterase